MMKSESGNFVKGLIAGTVVGIGVSMAVIPPEKNDMQKLEKRTGRALSAVGTMLENFVHYTK
ncbi:hypothetical protein [Treponema sp. R6D11]